MPSPANPRAPQDLTGRRSHRLRSLSSGADSRVRTLCRWHVSTPLPATASPDSTRRARRGRSSCPWPEAARSASPSIPATPTASTPPCASGTAAGAGGGGSRRGADGGQRWEDGRPAEPGVFSLGVSAADGAVYAGPEPSRLFRSDDRGESWRELEALLELPSRPHWSFPPR